ncbi:unnamed protein product [Linum tenue]|uniref:B3 domain-containing protein n=1 Tax=Linum tenue TaxID=586396 RepID=A0AAV0M1T0_9ROSI|nr:unnamed protein product [Linum tenue]
MLLTMDDVKEKLDFTNTKNKKLTPFEWLLAITPIALEKLHRQEKHERLAKESQLKKPIVPQTTTTTTTLGQDHDQHQTPSIKRKRNVFERTREDRKKKKNVSSMRRRKIDRDYFVDDPRLERATIPERFRHHIETNLNGRDIKLIVQKRLYESDLKTGEGRLSIPAKKMCQGLLTTKEEEWLRTRDRGEAVPSMELLLLDPELGEGKIVFKLWEMNKPNGTTSYMYVLARYWNHVVKKNGLKTGEVVQVWGFRMGEDEPGRLGLALVRLAKENGGEV